MVAACRLAPRSSSGHDARTLRPPPHTPPHLTHPCCCRDNLFDDLSVWANANLTTQALQDFRKVHREDDLKRWLMFYNNTLVLPFSDDIKKCQGCNPHVRVMLAGSMQQFTRATACIM